MSHTNLKGSKVIYLEKKYPRPRVKKSAADANREAERSFFIKDFLNKKTRVPPAPKPVRARAIAENVKLPKPSTLNTLMSEISRARSDEDVKNNAGKYNSTFTFLIGPVFRAGK